MSRHAEAIPIGGSIWRPSFWYSWPNSFKWPAQLFGWSGGRLVEHMTHVFKLFVLAALLCPLACDSSDTSAARGQVSEEPAGQILDPTQVPERLRHLVPLAGQWGIGDDTERAQFLERASGADREGLTAAVAPHQADITAWLDSFGTEGMSEEGAAFMYMQLALEEMR